MSVEIETTTEWGVRMLDGRITPCHSREDAQRLVYFATPGIPRVVIKRTVVKTIREWEEIV